jgi:hypothetical protein
MNRLALRRSLIENKLLIKDLVEDTKTIRKRLKKTNVAERGLICRILAEIHFGR